MSDPTTILPTTDSTQPKPGWKTTEFYLALVAKILGGAFAVGLIGDGTELARICGLAAVVLTSLGYTVNRTILKSLAMLVLALGFATHSMACGPKTKGAEQAFINCLEDDVKAKVPSLLPTVLTILSSGVSDWQAQLEALATYAGKDALACAVQAAALEFKSKVGAGSGSAGDGSGATRALDFIHDHGFSYRSSPTSLLDRSRPPMTNFIAGTLSIHGQELEMLRDPPAPVFELEHVKPDCESRNFMPVVNCVGGVMRHNGCRWHCAPAFAAEAQ